MTITGGRLAWDVRGQPFTADRPALHQIALGVGVESATGTAVTNEAAISLPHGRMSPSTSDCRPIGRVLQRLAGYEDEGEQELVPGGGEGEQRDSSAGTASGRVIFQKA